MPLAFEPVALDACYGDDHGMLVYRDDRLLAVVACLGEAHGDVAGHWFVEAIFSDRISDLHRTFETLSALEARLIAPAPSD